MVASWLISDEFIRAVALFERLLVPLAMVWLALRWFWIVRKTPTPEPASHEAKKELAEKIAKAFKRTERAFVVGILFAILIVMGVWRFCPADPGEDPDPVHGVLALGVGSIVCACVLGVAAGLALGLVEPKLKSWRFDRPRAWFGIVTLASATALASLVTYYLLPNYFWPHAWLVWGYICLFVSSSMAFLVGAES